MLKKSAMLYPNTKHVALDGTLDENHIFIIEGNDGVNFDMSGIQLKRYLAGL